MKLKQKMNNYKKVVVNSLNKSSLDYDSEGGTRVRIAIYGLSIAITACIILTIIVTIIR